MSWLGILLRSLIYSSYSRGWVPLRPSDSDFSQNWKPGTREIPLLSRWLGTIEAGEIPLLSRLLGTIEAQWFRLQPELEAWDRGDSLLLLWLGAIEAQWFRLQPELEAWDRRDSPTLTVVECHWAGQVIPTSARIGSLGPGRFPCSHCGGVPLRPSDSDFSKNWKPGTREIPLLSLWWGAIIEAQWFRLQPELEAWDREIPLLSLWLGTIEAQWFRLLPELEAWDQGDSPTLTVVPNSARIGSLGPGRFPYSHCGGVPLLRPSDSEFSQNWKPVTGEIPLLSLWLGAIEAQWFRLQPELEAWDREVI
jgi:hypothetical protein